jgi:hypothetical protein
MAPGRLVRGSSWPSSGSAAAEAFQVVDEVVGGLPECQIGSNVSAASRRGGALRSSSPSVAAESEFSVVSSQFVERMSLMEPADDFGEPVGETDELDR